MILDIENAIVARLEQEIGSLAKVTTANELADLEERAQITPAVHVIYGGYTPTNQAGQGAAQEIETRWIIVIAIRTARRDGATDKADPIIDTAFKALAGWKPKTGSRPMQLRSGPQAAHSNGFAYYPLAFATRETLRGDRA